MNYEVIVQVNDKYTEILPIETDNRDNAIKYAIRTYNEYLNKGFIKSYVIKGVK